MKSFFLLLFAVAVLVAGCESMSTRIAGRFTKVPPHARIFAADKKMVYYAAQTAVRKAGLRLGRTSIAQRSIDGYAPVRSGTATSDARQTTIEIRLFETETLDTRVELLVWEHTEGGFPGSVSGQALREHGLYEIYYAALQQVLQDGEILNSLVKP